MFGSAIVDVVIGLSFVFALVSTLCSAVREGLEAWLKTRASYLEYAIIRLLGGSQQTSEFFNHPLITALYVGEYVVKKDYKEPSVWERGRNLPSYIDARQFALTVLDLAARGRTSGDASEYPAFSLSSIRGGLSNLQNDHLQRALLVALDAAGDDFETAVANVEAWFDSAMERVSGWYKRSTQSILFAIALVVAVTMNINAIRIANYLYADPLARESIVKATEGTHPDQTYQETLTKLDGLALPIGWDVGWSLTPIGHADATANPEQPVGCGARLQGLCEFIEQVDPWRDIFGPVFGILATAFAATLGAPFWFDVVNKFMVIRSTVKPREKSQEEGSKDRPPTSGAGPLGSAPNGSEGNPPAASGRASNANPNPGTSTASRIVTPPEPDGCDEPILDQLPDEKLPEAQGGVEVGLDQQGGSSS